MSTLAVNTITNAAGANTAQINGMTPTADSLQGFRNRLINSDMRIDQRNAGASVTANNNVFGVDRFGIIATQSSKGTVQRSTVAPAGFTNSLLFTSSSAYSLAAGDAFTVAQMIEGFNTADLGWGAAGAQAVTLSFWVRSSLTGTFGGVINNSAYTRSYPFTYTVSAANTFEYKTITIPGDTTGTWLTDNSAGIRVQFGLGAGATFSGTAGAWAAANLLSATGAVSVVGTSGATFYITGVQLEAGSVATPFERRPYGTELSLCQRYFVRFGGSGYSRFGFGWVNSTTQAFASMSLPVAMRAAPTFSSGGSISASTMTSSSFAIDAAGTDSLVATIVVNGSGGTAKDAVAVTANNDANAFVAWSAEL